VPKGGKTTWTGKGTGRVRVFLYRKINIAYVVQHHMSCPFKDTLTISTLFPIGSCGIKAGMKHSVIEIPPPLWDWPLAV